MLSIPNLLAAVILLGMVVLSIKTGKLTLTGGITGGFAAIAIYLGAGYTGLAMLGVFFISGTLTTNWRKGEKQKFKATEDRSTKRNAGQVLANGGVAAIAGILILLLPSKAGLFSLMMAASLASATADTLSSELGMIYGKRFYNIINWKKEQKGLDGVISLEGTLIGVAGAALISLIYATGFGWSSNLGLIIIAGTIGNLSDSVLGAVFERKKYVGNDMVNFLNTLIAALFVFLCIAK